MHVQVRGASGELVRAASEIMDLHLRHVEQLHDMRARTAKKESEYAAAQVRHDDVHDDDATCPC